MEILGDLKTNLDLGTEFIKISFLLHLFDDFRGKISFSNMVLKIIFKI